MYFQLVVRSVVIPFHGGFLDCSVHAFHLSVRPGMFWFCEPVFNAVPLLLRGEYRVRDFNGALVASWPLAESFELLARGGIASTRFDYDEHGNDAGGHPYSFHARTRTRSNAQAGIGALWRFAPHFALRLDLDRNFDVGKTFALNPDGNGHFDHIDAYTLNLLWQP